MARSNASSLLDNGAADDEIAAALAGHEDTLREALAGWRCEALALCDLTAAEIETWIRENLKGFMALTMGRYSPEARKEFCDQALVEFAQVPVAMLDDAIAVAKREVSHPEKLVPFVFKWLEDRMRKFDTEGSRLRRLASTIDPDRAS